MVICGLPRLTEIWISCQKIRNFQFCSFLVVGVALFIVRRPSNFVYFVWYRQNFSIFFISCSWGSCLHRNTSWSNFECLVSDGQSFYILFIICSWDRSSPSIWSVYGLMRTASLDLILNILSQKIRSFLFSSFPETEVALFTEFLTLKFLLSCLSWSEL